MRRRRSSSAYWIPALALLLMFSQGLMGAAYAAWQDQLGVFGRMDTGSFALSFSHGDCRAYLVERSRPEYAAAALEMECTLGGDQKSVTLELTQADLTALLLEGDRLLAIAYPLKADAGSTVTHAAPREADLWGEPDESLQLEAAQPVLLAEGEVYALPAWADALKQNLYFDVHHALELRQGQMTGVLYLALEAESKAYLREAKSLCVEASELPPELCSLLTPAGGGTSAFLTGELQIAYHATLPLCVQQGVRGAGEEE